MVFIEIDESRDRVAAETIEFVVAMYLENSRATLSRKYTQGAPLTVNASQSCGKVATTIAVAIADGDDHPAEATDDFSTG